MNDPTLVPLSQRKGPAVSYRLVPMSTEDIPQIAALERECFSRPWSEHLLADALNDLTASFIVARADDGQVLGYAGIHVVAGEGYIDNIAVRQEYRRQKVASALLDVFIRFGQANGLEFLTLEVRPSNAPALAFYMKHGFVQVGRRKNYYDEPREDAILMTYTFGDEEQP